MWLHCFRLIKFCIIILIINILCSSMQNNLLLVIFNRMIGNFYTDMLAAMHFVCYVDILVFFCYTDIGLHVHEVGLGRQFRRWFNSWLLTVSEDRMTLNLIYIVHERLHVYMRERYFRITGTCIHKYTYSMYTLRDICVLLLLQVDTHALAKKKKKKILPNFRSFQVNFFYYLWKIMLLQT